MNEFTIAASVVVVVNQDDDYAYPTYVTTCRVVELAARHLLGHTTTSTTTLDFGCLDAEPDPPRACVSVYGRPTCVPAYDHHNASTMNKTECAKVCGKSFIE